MEPEICDCVFQLIYAHLAILCTIYVQRQTPCTQPSNQSTPAYKSTRIFTAATRISIAMRTITIFVSGCSHISKQTYRSIPTSPHDHDSTDPSKPARDL